MTKITDINGAAMQPLRSIKKPQVNESFQSRIKDSKLKQTSEEIVSALLSSIKGSDEYTIQLHSKMSDVVLGRIASLKADVDISQEDLLELKDSIVSDIQKTGLTDNMKQQLQQSVSTAINSTSPSDDSSKVIEELKKLDEQLSKEQESVEPVLSEPSNTENEEQQFQQIEDLKDAFSQQMAKINDLPNAVDGKIQKPFQQLNKTINNLSKKTTPTIQKQNEMVGKQLGSVQEAIAKRTESIGKSFEEMKTTTVVGIEKKQEQTQKTTEKLNPLKKLFAKKDDQTDDKFQKYKNKFMPNFMSSTQSFATNQEQFILDVLKRNTKNIHKALKKTIAAMVTTLVIKVAASVLKIMTKLASFLGDLIFKLVGGLMKGLFAPFKPVLYAIAIALGLIMAAVIMAMFKFPELIKPITESLAKLAELMVKVVVWLIQEVWTWLSGTLWPFLKEDVWGFISNDLWTFISERVFPIIERIYKWIWEEFWPFLCNELWPFILEQVGKIFTWIETELWPFVLETFTWLRDTIITPVWQEFVLPVLTWVVDKVMPWIAANVGPVIKTILEILKEFLDAIKPWIAPLYTKMFKIIDWLLKLFQKVFKILEPGIMSIVNCVKNLFVGVFNLLKNEIIAIVEFVELFIKAFKQAWNQLCDYFADVCIDISTPKSWPWPLKGVHILGPYYPFSGMRSLKFDMGGSAAGKPSVPSNEAPDSSSESDKEALERLNNYRDSAYGRIFHYLGILAKLLGINVSDSPALKPLSSAGVFSGTAHLRNVDATKKLDKYGDNPITKIAKIIDNIIIFLDRNITPAITQLVKATGHEDLAITVKVDEVAKDKAKEVEGNKVDEETQQQSTFDPNEFVNELFSDENEDNLKTDDDNAFSFLANNVFPYMKDNIKPLVMRIRELADGIKPTNNSVVNILKGNQQEDMNYALVDQ